MEIPKNLLRLSEEDYFSETRFPLCLNVASLSGKNIAFDRRDLFYLRDISLDMGVNYLQDKVIILGSVFPFRNGHTCSVF